MADIDLEQLAALVAAMTPGPWRVSPLTPFSIVEDRDGGHFLGIASVPERSWGPGNTAGIVALVNAAPDLLRLARLGQAYVAHCNGTDDGTTDDIEDALDACRAGKETPPPRRPGKARARIAALESALAGIVARYDAGRASHGDTMVALGGAEAVAEADGWIDSLRAVLEGRTP